MEENYEKKIFIVEVVEVVEEKPIILAPVILIVLLFYSIASVYPLSIKHFLFLVLCLVFLLFFCLPSTRDKLSRYKYLRGILIAVSLSLTFYSGFELKRVNQAEQLFNKINIVNYDKKKIKDLCLDGVYNRPLTIANGKYFTKESLAPFQLEILSYDEYKTKMEKDYNNLIYNVQANINANDNDIDDIYIVLDPYDKKHSKNLAKTVSNLILAKQNYQTVVDNEEPHIYMIEESDFKRFITEQNSNFEYQNIENIELPTVFTNHPQTTSDILKDKATIKENIDNSYPEGYVEYYDYSYTIHKEAYMNLTGKDYSKRHTYTLFDQFKDLF